jgi:hypothetical protein
MEGSAETMAYHQQPTSGALSAPPQLMTQAEQYTVDRPDSRAYPLSQVGTQRTSIKCFFFFEVAGKPANYIDKMKLQLPLPSGYRL